MEVEEAVRRAKDFLRQVYKDEEVSQVRLEEVDYDSTEDIWLITLGIMRPSITKKSATMASMLGELPLKRTYKVVRIHNDGSGMPTMKMRVFLEDAE